VTAALARVECLGHYVPQLQILFNRVPLQLDLVALDGMPPSFTACSLPKIAAI